MVTSPKPLTRITNNSGDVVDIAREAFIVMNQRNHLLCNAALKMVSYRADDVSDDGTANVIACCDASYNVEACIDIATAGTWRVDFYTDPTISVTGTTLTVVNKNRTGADEGSADFYYGSTIGATGTQIYTGITESHKAGAGSTTLGDWILEAGTNYYLLLTNKSGVTGDTGVSIEFKETAV